MGKKLYVGNLPFSATEQVLTDTFAQCGTVESAKIITDRDTGRSKGFGFVEMATEAEAQAAISKLNGADYEGRAMTVNEWIWWRRRSRWTRRRTSESLVILFFKNKNFIKEPGSNRSWLFFLFLNNL
jgi:RNA recognition motif-containing protein